ncbi:hypothetical protein SAY86_029591 [Trapa natans]|uniref:Uncharacterized protein n=1 Tax=Trapa natans TaxID=22666 RepID=A0AAN7M1J1_TRANT|nr:hypothetical protein SAY86_029591 [Trapa natans]
MGPPHALPVLGALPMSSGTSTELSLSLNATGISKLVPLCSKDERPGSNIAGNPHDKPSSQFLPLNKKDEIILSHIPRFKELQNQLKGWNEWANQKVMQAAQRLSKDKVELKLLRQESSRRRRRILRKAR